MLPKFSVLILMFLLALTPAGPAQAQAVEAPSPDFRTLTQALFRFGALDLTSDAVMDEYALVMYCDLYQRHFADDFTWNRVRGGIRSDIQRQVATVPTTFSLTAIRRLSRYDFDKQIFPLDPQTPLRGINAVALADAPEKICGQETLRLLPRGFRALLDFPFTVEGIPMGEKEAQKLFNRMTAAKNLSRELYLRITIRLTFAEPIRLEPGKEGPARYSFDGRLESVEFFEDKDLTRLLYTYAP